MKPRKVQSNYRLAHDHFSSVSASAGGLPPEKRLGWIVDLLPYVEGGGPWLMDKTIAWDEGVNRALRRRDKFSDRIVWTEGVDRYAVVHCPSQGAADHHLGYEPSSYVGIAGLGPDAVALPAGDPRAGLFGYDRPIAEAAITDGAANTMAIAETAEFRGPWKAGGPATIRGLDPGRKPYIGRDRPFGGVHRDGAMIAFADGSVRFVRETIDPEVFEALSTISGGEPLPAGWDR